MSAILITLKIEIMEKILLNIEKRLSAIEKMLAVNKTVLTFQEAADYSGLSRSYLYKLTSKGIIPHFKPEGKMIYFERTQLEKWLLRNPIYHLENE